MPLRTLGELLNDFDVNADPDVAAQAAKAVGELDRVASSAS